MNMVIGSETSNPLEDRGSGNAVEEQVVENCRIRGDSTVFAAFTEVDRNLQSFSGGQHMQLHHNDAPLMSRRFLAAIMESLWQGSPRTIPRRVQGPHSGRDTNRPRERRRVAGSRISPTRR